MINYEKITTEFGIDFIVRTNEDGTQSWIPCDPANSDYQRYLRWLENPDADETQGGMN
jgi:hypothetical protein